MEVLKLSIQEALITMFTDDPINWLKCGRICGPDRRLCHRGAALQKGVPRRQLGTETGHRKEQGPRHQSVSGGQAPLR